MASSFVPSARKLEKYQQQAATTTRPISTSPGLNVKLPPPPTAPVIPPIAVHVVSSSLSSSPSSSSAPSTPGRLLIFSRGGDGTPRGINDYELITPRRGDLIASTLHTASVEDIERELEALLAIFEGKLITETEYEDRKTHLEELQREDISSSSYSSSQTEFHTPYLSTTSEEFFTVLDGKTTSGPVRSSYSPASLAPSEKQREIRVFLSSTFKDMQDERDWLVKTAFPQIRKFCAERGVFFAEVDLRWGITADQAENGDTLDLCLSEIDRCRPYFINITKNRYGWIPSPDQVKPTTVEKFPWLRKHICDESGRNDSEMKSVTELEVWHAALNDDNRSSANNKCLFYTKKQRLEVKLSSDDYDHPQKLEAMRNRIKNKGYQLKEYDTSSHLGELVVRDLRAAIESDFPVSSKLSKLESDSMSHRTFATKKTKLYHGRQSYFTQLTRYLASPSSTPLVVVGEEGSGKTSLLANFFHQFKGTNNELVITHYLGASSESADYRTIMSRILQTLKPLYKIEEEVDTNIEKLSRDFGRWLKTYVPKTSKLVVVLDGLDELLPIDRSQTLGWLPVLPGSLPEDGRVKLILSVRKGHKAHEILKRSLGGEKSLPSLVVQPLNESEREGITKNLMSLYGKSLTTPQLITLSRDSSSVHTSNPLFLRLVLEEIRVFGVYEEIDSRIDYYLRARSISELYERILDRLEKDFGTGLVRETFCLLTVSRKGLSETELLAITELPRVELSPLLLATSELMVSSNGLLNLNHDGLKKAVERRYMPFYEQRRKYHLDIANHFETTSESENEDVTRKALELPHHLLISEHWYRLLLSVSNMKVFLYLCTKDTLYELKKYWIALERKGYQPTESYLEAINEYESSSNLDNVTLASTILKVAKFLRASFHYEGARNLLTRVLELVENNNSTVASIIRAKSLYVMAQSYWNQGNWSQAKGWANQSLEAWECNSGTGSLRVGKCLTGLGEVYIGEEDMVKAEVTLTRALNIFDNLLGKENNHWSTRVMHDLASVANSYGDWEKALSLHFRAIRIRERVLGEEHPQLAVSWETYGATLKLSGRIPEAEIAFRNALRLNEVIHGISSVNVAGTCEWLVIVLRDQNKHGEANQLEDRAKQIQQELTDRGISASAVERTID